MTMKISRLITHWTADEADTVVTLLDELRDALWQTYGDEIIEMRRNAMMRTETNTDQGELAFDDDIDF